MKFYIATTLENAAQAREVATALKAAGHEQTYDWTRHGSVQAGGFHAIREAAMNEEKGVRDADIVVMLLPGARGAHAELGMAIALKKWVIIYGRKETDFIQTGRTCAFYCSPSVQRIVGPLPEAIRKIKTEMYKRSHFEKIIIYADDQIYRTEWRVLPGCRPR